MIGAMNRGSVAALLLIVPALAQPERVPGWFLSGMNRVQFVVSLDHEAMHGGTASAMIRCTEKRCESFGTLMQTIKADEYLGQRVRLSAWVKASDAGKPRIWMRIDGQNGEVLAFDNMDNRSKNGSFHWQLQQIVLNVNKPAVLINFGFMLEGHGVAWIDDVSLDVVDRKVKDTSMMSGSGPGQADPRSIGRRWEAAPAQPANLDFEQTRETGNQLVELRRW